MTNLNVNVSQNLITDLPANFKRETADSVEGFDQAFNSAAKISDSLSNSGFQNIEEIVNKDEIAVNDGSESMNNQADNVNSIYSFVLQRPIDNTVVDSGKMKIALAPELAKKLAVNKDSDDDENYFVGNFEHIVVESSEEQIVEDDCVALDVDNGKLAENITDNIKNLKPRELNVENNSSVSAQKTALKNNNKKSLNPLTQLQNSSLRPELRSETVIVKEKTTMLNSLEEFSQKVVKNVQPKTKSVDNLEVKNNSQSKTVDLPDVKISSFQSKPVVEENLNTNSLMKELAAKTGQALNLVTHKNSSKGKNINQNSSHGSEKMDHLLSDDKTLSEVKNTVVNKTTIVASNNEIAKSIMQAVDKIRSAAALGGNIKENMTMQQAEVRIDSVQYGALRLGLQEDGGKLGVTLTAENNSLNSLLDQKKEIVQSLKDSGYTDVEVDIQQESDSRERFQQAKHAASGNEDADNVKLAGDAVADLQAVMNNNI